MAKVRIFSFNPFQVNTFLVYNESGICFVFDAACNSPGEKDTLYRFIKEQGLKIKGIYNTHGHVDHLLGNKYLTEMTGAPVYMHIEDLFLVETAVEHGQMFGMDVEPPPIPEHFLDENDSIAGDDMEAKIIHLPGHSPGSIGFYFEKENFIILGDVLFNGSIGRTDLPGGDYLTLINSIKTKLLTLDDDLVVYSGHGPATTIGKEKKNNPFLQ